MKKIIKLLIVALIVLCSTFTGRNINAEIAYPEKGNYIKILVDNSEYRVAKQTSDGEHTYLVSSFDGTSMKWNSTASNVYTDSDMQKHLLQIYNDMPTKKKDAVVEQTSLKQHRYRVGDTPVHSGERDFTGQKYVYLLDVQDVLDYAEGITGNGPRHRKMRELFFNEVDKSWSSGENVWLLSAHNSYDDAVYKVYNNGFASDASVRNNSYLANPAFVVDLDKLTAKITFDSKGGSEVDEQKVPLWTVNGADPSNYATEPTDPTRTGYTFEYWYLDNENAAYDFTNTPVTDDITLKAKWKANKYNVTFMHNGEEFDVQEIEYNGTASEPTRVPETTGMQVFDGWYKGNEPFDFNTRITEAITLTSKMNEYTYEYVGDTKTWTKGGSGSLTLTFKRMYNGDVMNTDGDDTIGTHAKFESFEVKGSTLDKSNYTYSKGSVNVDLKDSYLNSLSEGTYNCKAKFADGGEASASFVVKEKSTPTPKPTPTPSQNVTPRVVPNTSAR